MTFGAEIPWDRRDEVFDRLRERRVLFLRGVFDQAAADRLVAELLTLEALGSGEIRLLINSTGGPVANLFPVTDTISLLHCSVATTCTGEAMGIAAALLAAGSGPRQAAAHARLSVRIQTEHGFKGTAGDLTSEARQLELLHHQLAAQLASATGRPPQHVAADIDRGGVMTAADAASYGLIDRVLE